MRVISGTARGKKLNSLAGLETRPTLDRVKEALFNILQFNIKEASVLDLFSCPYTNKGELNFCLV